MAMMIILRLGIALSFIHLAMSVCPSGWARYGKNCYFIFADKKNRSEADSLCASHSASLLSITDENEWSFISKLIKAAQLDTDAWIGLQFSEKKWKWDDDTVYKELRHWKVSVSSTPSTIPQPDENLSQARIKRDESNVFLDLAGLASTLHPFCKRDIESRDLCDTNNGWVRISGFCYQYNLATTWDDAVVVCSGFGAALLSPTGQRDLNPISELSHVNTSVWINARDIEGSGIYSTGTKVKVDFLPWLPDGSPDLKKACVAAKQTDSSPKYYTELCEVELPYICQKPEGTCPLGWFQDGLQCYKLHVRPEEKLTWPMAVDYCKKRGAQMVQGDVSQRAKAILHQALEENDITTTWLGFSENGETSHYLDNSPVTVPTTQFNTTNTQGGTSRCGITDFLPERDSYLAGYCYTPRPFVCTAKLTDALTTSSQSSTICSTGWISFNSKCYKIEGNPVSYSDALKHCASMGASIATVSNSIQQSLFSAPAFLDEGSSLYWIGVKYDGSKKSYVLDGTNDKIAFFNFSPYQFEDETEGPCVFVGTGYSTTFIGSWFRDKCSVKHGYVCQKPGKTDQQQDKLVSVSWSPRCGVGWTYSSTTNMCYFVSAYNHVSWQQASQECISMQGSLLSISGNEEQSYIESLLKSQQYKDLEESLWIGAGELAEGKGWGWKDSQPFSFIHWGEGQPYYDSDDGDNCGYIPVTKDFRWEARPCGDGLGFICKKYALPKPNEEFPTPPPLMPCDPVPLISGDHSLQFPQDFSASSYKDEGHRPEFCRLVPFNNASWSPANDSTNEWLAVTFHSPVTVTDISMRGEDSTDRYVTKFKLQYQFDSSSPWYWFVNPDNSVKIFSGVSVPDGGAFILLGGEIKAHAYKIWPVEWSYGIAIRMEFNGCPEDQCVPDYGMSGPLFVSDEQITASSEASPEFAAVNARLRPAKAHKKLSVWKPAPTDKHPWIQVDLGTERIVCGITTQENQTNSDLKFQLLFSRTTGEFINYTQPYAVPYVINDLSEDGSAPNTLYLKSSVQARIVRLAFHPPSDNITLKFDLLVCSIGCQAQAVLSDVPKAALTASDFQSKYSPDRSLLSTVKENSIMDCWKPTNDNTGDKSFLQVDLGRTMQITAVATRGSFEGSWVKSYFLAFSTDGKVFKQYGGDVTHNSANGQHTSYNDSVLYQGNFDQSTVVKNELSPPVNARFVQLWPHDFHKSVCVKWEVYACSKHTASEPIGCYTDQPNDPDLPFVPFFDKYGTMWPEICLSHCYVKGYLYAGLQNGDKCSCGNDYGMYGETNGCDTPCQEPYNNFTCGGTSKNLIYSTGLGAESYVCQSGWVSYKDYCYRLIREKETWLNAHSKCEKLNSNLVDITDKGENQFVTSLLKNGERAWIGLNDILQTLNFEWSSEREVLYTNWAYRQPVVNPGLEQHSVLISSYGGWRNSFSEDVYPYVCKTSKNVSDIAVHDRKDPGCPKSWRGFGNKCYLFKRMKNSWDKANDECQVENGTLAHIEMQEENEFLSSVLSRLDSSYWIDVVDNSSGLYTHQEGNPQVSFAKWTRGKPDSSGKCVSLMTGQFAGEWSNMGCDVKNMILCEQPRASSGFTTKSSTATPTLTTKPAAGCDTDWEQVGDMCVQFNIVNVSSHRLNWHEASENCKQQGAELTSFHTGKDFDAVMAKIMSQGNKTGNFWVGLNNFNPSLGFQWSDGSVLNFVKWYPGHPIWANRISRCGEILTVVSSMVLQSCSQLRNWLCSIPVGKAVIPIKPVVYPQPNGACIPLSPRWLRYKDYCYYFADGEDDANESKTWRGARQWCGLQGADLTSINSDEENRFLQGMLLYGVKNEAVWTGLNELDRGSGYSWSDNSPVNVLNWNVNEPNDYNGFEACVEFQVRNGKLNDQHCAKRRGFVCKRPAPGVTIPTTTPATQAEGNCLPDFTKFGRKCYRLMGVGSGGSRLNWKDAQASCRAYNWSETADLVSISSPLENAFVTALMNEYKVSAWIGLKRLPSGQFLWSDNQELTFESWNMDEPNMKHGFESCVYMYGPAVFAGKWNDVSCLEKAAYICESSPDLSLPPDFKPPSAICNVTQGFQQFGRSCYKVVNKTVTWQQAKTDCSLLNSHLASVLDGYDLAEMLLLTNSFIDGVWIGLNDLQTRGTYEWESGYPVTYTPWAHHQPLDQTGWGCVYMNSKGLFNNGPCQEGKAFVCRSDTEPPQEIPSQPGGSCLSSNFTQQGSLCYLMVLDQLVTYEAAELECKKRRATLASIHSPSVSFNIPQGQGVWIGLRESLNEGFSWEDFTELGFTNWQSSSPKWSGTDESDQGCVVMWSDGTWSNEDCEDSHGFLCSSMIVFDLGTVSMPQVTVTEETPKIVTKKIPITVSQETPPTPFIISRVTHGLTSTPSHHTNGKGTSLKYSTQPDSAASSSSTKKPIKSANKGSNSLSGGETAGIVIGVLAFLMTISFVVYVVWRRGYLRASFLRHEASRTKNFENSLYEETRKDTLTKMEDAEMIRIGGSNSRNLSVSYVPPSSSEVMDIEMEGVQEEAISSGTSYQRMNDDDFQA